MSDLKKAGPFDVITSAQKPQQELKTPHLWLGKPILKPEHHADLEAMSAINEFAHGLPRKKAEEQAYEEYQKGHRIEAASHHLQGMKAAQAAGDMDTARKHSMMYQMHSKALGTGAVDKPHPAVQSMVDSGKVKQRFKPHKGDMFAALNPPEPDVISSAPPPEMGKAEISLLLGSLYEALVKGEVVGKIGNPAGAKKQPKALTQAGNDIGKKKAQIWAKENGYEDKSKPTKKGELDPSGAKVEKPKPCWCPALRFPHRHKSHGDCPEMRQEKAD